MAPFLPKGLLAKALDLALAIQEDEQRARALEAVASLLKGKDVERTLQAALALPPGVGRIRALMAMGHTGQLSRSRWAQAGAIIWQDVDSLKASFENVRMVAECQDEVELLAWLAGMVEGEERSHLVEMGWKALVAFNPDGTIQEDGSFKAEDERWNRIIHKWPFRGSDETLLIRTIDFARQEGDPDRRNRALLLVSGCLPAGPALTHALESPPIFDDWRKSAAAIKMLVSHLPGWWKAEWSRWAAEQASRIRDEELRAKLAEDYPTPAGGPAQPTSGSLDEEATGASFPLASSGTPLPGEPVESHEELQARLEQVLSQGHPTQVVNVLDELLPRLSGDLLDQVVARVKRFRRAHHGEAAQILYNMTKYPKNMDARTWAEWLDAAAALE